MRQWCGAVFLADTFSSVTVYLFSFFKSEKSMTWNCNGSYNLLMPYRGGHMRIINEMFSNLPSRRGLDLCRWMSIFHL